MIKRGFTWFLLALFVWMAAVAVAGVANMPPKVLPYALAHAPGFVVQIFVIWLLVPALILFFLVAGPVPELGRFGPFFRRLTKGCAIPPDRERWMKRMLVVLGLFMAFGQAWQTLALVLLWHKRQLPWVVQTMYGPHFWSLPDPHHLIPRLWPAAGGLLVAWFGNGLPKLLTPFRGGREPYDWGAMTRACGWVMTLGGLAGVMCSLLIADLHTAVLANAVILATSVLAPLVSWAIYRLGGARPNAIPPDAR